MKKSVKLKIFDSVSALILALFVICFAATFALNFRYIYEKDLESMELDKVSGVAAEDILSDYDRLIEYNNIGGPDKLTFRHFRMSDAGRTHFREVRTIFTGMEYALILFGLASLTILFVHKRNELGYSYLKTAGIGLILLPAVLGILAISFWDRFFVTFHELFFDNDYWIFDETKDPIIKVLPDEFFFHEATLIFAIVLISGLILIATGKTLSKERKHHYPDSKCRC